MSYTLLYTIAAVRDIPKLKAVKLDKKAKSLCESLSENPTPTFCKKLIGSLTGKYSLRINIQHRIVYEIFEDIKQFEF